MSLTDFSSAIFKFDDLSGDSGSALVFVSNVEQVAKEEEETMFYIAGVTSFGVSCFNRRPSFYTRVSSYLKWIEETVWQ